MSVDRGVLARMWLFRGVQAEFQVQLTGVHWLMSHRVHVHVQIFFVCMEHGIKL